MPRQKNTKQKMRITVTVDPEVIEALGPLQAKLEAQAYGALTGREKSLVGPSRYSRSSVVQMAILALCAKMDIPVRWQRSDAGDAGDAEIQEEV